MSIGSISGFAAAQSMFGVAVLRMALDQERSLVNILA
jgi:hypothetical protein